MKQGIYHWRIWKSPLFTSQSKKGWAKTTVLNAVSDAKAHTSACVAPDCPNWSILPVLFHRYNSSCYGSSHGPTLQLFWISMCEVVNQVTHFTVVGSACSWEIKGWTVLISPSTRGCASLFFAPTPGGRSAAPVALFRRAQCLSRKIREAPTTLESWKCVHPHFSSTKNNNGAIFQAKNTDGMLQQTMGLQNSAWQNWPWSLITTTVTTEFWRIVQMPAWSKSVQLRHQPLKSSTSIKYCPCWAGNRASG